MLTQSASFASPVMIICTWSSIKTSFEVQIQAVDIAEDPNPPKKRKKQKTKLQQQNYALHMSDMRV